MEPYRFVTNKIPNKLTYPMYTAPRRQTWQEGSYNQNQTHAPPSCLSHTVHSPLKSRS